MELYLRQFMHIPKIHKFVFMDNQQLIWDFFKFYFSLFLIIFIFGGGGRMVISNSLKLLFF